MDGAGGVPLFGRGRRVCQAHAPTPGGHGEVEASRRGLAPHPPRMLSHAAATSPYGRGEELAACGKHLSRGERSEANGMSFRVRGVTEMEPPNR